VFCPEQESAEEQMAEVERIFFKVEGMMKRGPFT
jgi:hypothetical protein